LAVPAIETEVSHQTKVDSLNGYLSEKGINPIKVEDTPLYTRFVFKEVDPTQVVVYRGIRGDTPDEFFDQTPYGARIRDRDGSIHTDPSLLRASNLLSIDPTPRNLIQWFKVRKEVEKDIGETEHLLTSMIMAFEYSQFKAEEIPNLERMMRFDQGRRIGSHADTWYTPYVSGTTDPKEAMGYSRYKAMLVLSLGTNRVMHTSSSEVDIKGAIERSNISEIILIKPIESGYSEEEIKQITESFNDHKVVRVEGSNQDTLNYTKKDFDSILPYLKREYSELYAKKIAIRYPKLMTDPSFKLETLSGDPYTDMVYSIFKHYRERDGRQVTDEDIEEYRVVIPIRKYRETEIFVGNLPGMEELRD